MKQTNTKIQVGVLLPRSSIYLAAGLHFLNGLRLAAEEDKWSEFIIEDIGIGSSRNQVADKTQKLLLQHQADIVVAFIGNGVAEELVETFEAYNKLLIVVNAGEHIVHHDTNPHVIYHTLILAESAWESAKYIKQNYGPKVTLASAFYDVGYGLTPAFENSLGQNGGTIISRFIAQHEIKPRDIEKFGQYLDKDKPDAVYAVYSGMMASTFVNLYFDAGLHHKYPLFAGGMTGEASVLSRLNASDAELESIQSWFPAIEDQANQEFKTSYSDLYNEEPSVFALLGFESGLILNRIAQMDTLKFIDTSELGVFEGGTSFQIINNQTRRELYMSCLDNQDGKRFLQTTKKIGNEALNSLNELTSSDFYEFDHQRVHGWLNPYLFV